MNNKLARQLRKEANYHPSQKREYSVINQSRKLKTKRVKVGGKWVEVATTERKQGTVELVDSDPRTLYRELKKEYK